MTGTQYLAGIAAAVGSGLAFNTGLFLQQSAVKRLPVGARPFPAVLRSSVWLAGFAIQFVLGAPLNILSTGLIGPALTPGLIAVGLGILPLLAAVKDKTRIRSRELAGLACVVGSAVCIGLSRLTVTMSPAMLADVSLLLRTAALVGAAVVLALLLGAAGARTKRRAAGYLLTLAAGLWLGTTGPAVGFLAAALQRLPQGIDRMLLLAGGTALLVAVAGSVLGIAVTQRAFQHGSAHVLVPIQYLPVQMIPLLSFFLVFRPFTPAPASIGLALLGIVGIAAGAGMLSSR
jgi:hypothetical protein